MFCQKCGTQNDDVARFCENCGEPMEAPIQAEPAPAAAPVEPAPKVAPEAPVAAAPVEPLSVNEDYTAEATDKKKFIKIGIIAAAAILVIVLVCVIGSKIFSGGNKVDYDKYPLVYAKDESLLVGKNPKKAYEATDEYDGGGIKITDDGKYLFYTGEASEMGGYELLYRKTSDKKSEGTRLDKGVMDFKIPADGSFVVYRTNDGDLRFHNLKDDKKLDSEVSTYMISSDEKYIIYVSGTGEKDLYVCKTSMKAEPEKVESNIVDYALKYDDEKGAYIYNGEFYIQKDDKLYFKKVGKDKEKILSDVASFSYIGETLFAAKADTEEISYSDVVNDDCKEEDDEVGYFDDEYEEVSRRNQLRYYDGRTAESRTYTIYKIDGKKAKEIEGKYSDISLYNQILYKGDGEEDGIEKITLSKIKTEEDYEAATEKLDAIFNNYGVSGGTPCVLKEKGEVIELKGVEEDAHNFSVSEDEKFFYCLEDKDEKGKEGTSTYVYSLNKYKITSKGAASKQAIAEDVVSFEVTDKFVVVFTTDGKSRNFGVYDSKYIEVAEDISDVYYNTEVLGDTIYYMEDINDKNSEGTLVRYTIGKKPQVIDEDVALDRSILIKNDGECFYIKDFNTEKGYGDLYHNKGKKNEQIDEEVKRIVGGGSLASLSVNGYGW